MASAVNFSGNFLITGMEIIVPNVPIPESKGVECLNPQRKQSPINIPPLLTPEEIERISNEDVIEAVPISFELPELCSTNILRMDQQLMPQEEGRPVAMQTVRRSTKIVSISGPITFKLPKDYVDYILKLEEEEERVTPAGVGRLSLLERLEGWTIEKRQRENKRFDKFYHHDKSKRMFRSFVEVVRFIIYSLYPQRPGHSKDRRSEEGPLAIQPWRPESSRRASLKRKRAPQTFYGSAKVVKEINSSPSAYSEEPSMAQTVEEILEKAYKNLLNLSNTQKENLCSSSSAHCEEETPQTIEELLDKENENLLNLFNKELQAAQENMGKSKKERREGEGRSSTNPYPNSTPLNPVEEPMIHNGPINPYNITSIEKFLFQD